MSVPCYFSVRIVKLDEARAFWTFTQFGETLGFKAYSVLLLLIESFFPLIILTILNMVTLLKFREVMKNKEQLVASQQHQRVNKANNRFTKLIITLTFLSISTRSFDFSIEVVNRVYRTNLLSYSDELFALSDLLRQIAYFLLFATHALDGLLFFVNDRQLRLVAFRCGFERARVGAGL